MNRVQFQPGLSMAEFFHRYGTDTLCEAALIQSRWPTGFVCPDCGCAVHSAFRRTGRLYWQCSACRHPCPVTSGTIFESSKLRLSTWFLAMHLLTQSKNFISALTSTDGDSWRQKILKPPFDGPYRRSAAGAGRMTASQSL